MLLREERRLWDVICENAKLGQSELSGGASTSTFDVRWKD